MLALFIFVAVTLAGISVMAWRGDARTDLRRCPRCWYDMAAIPSLACPECGFVAPHPRALHQPRRASRPWRRALIALWALFLLTAYAALPGHWTTKVPRPVVRAILHLTAAAPAPARAGALPTPNPALYLSRSAWDRLVWQHQATLAFQAWADAALAKEGPLSDAELACLVPLANQAHELFRLAGGLSWAEAWLDDRTIDRLARIRDAARDNPDAFLRAEWALSELQYQGAGYAWRHDFARLPDDLIRRALAHPDAPVRLFGLERFGRRAHQMVMEPTSPAPPSRTVVEALVRDDPDPAVRKRAADLVAYLDAFLPPR
ncbi:MAG: hypothetical protein JNK35_00855 [Phycisphaerae bacterium]|nr:hypothetical protein [Phycisphaerae bacterium]